MTENLRYIGPTTGDFHQGEVYSTTVSIQNEMYWLSEEGRQGHPYSSLADLLRYWQPASAPWTPRDPNGQALADEGVALS
ncbi:hypothetical protein [Hymenobacter fodinae]|uniref:Uncharacterized protein n=1 Tax=Hymenobacter fodinae TaxID=2510796 RepID=A0A4Z0P6Q5_9BACT|nr:hypothetical protein [Hymenobacter fodinae]TGE07690.1 hypothetical protein EU556_08020 [Hymenobacter fodinae]